MLMMKIYTTHTHTLSLSLCLSLSLSLSHSPGILSLSLCHSPGISARRFTLSSLVTMVPAALALLCLIPDHVLSSGKFDLKLLIGKIWKIHAWRLRR